MALATQCPHCHTTFRVAHDQLKLRAGLVRCGACKQIFNGIENLLPPEQQPQQRGEADAVPAAAPRDDTPAPASAAPAATPPAPTATAVPPPGVAPAAPASPPVPEPHTPEDKPEAQPTTAEPDQDDRHPPAEDEAVPEQDDVDVAQAGGEPDQIEPYVTGPADEPLASPAEPDDPLLRMTLMDVRGDEDEENAPERVAAEQDYGPDPLDRAIEDLQSKPLRAASDDAGQARTETAGPDDDYEEPSFVRQGRRRQRMGRALRITMGAGSFVLLLAFVAQAAYVFRDQLAAHFPETKPVLLEACAWLDCQVGLPAQIDEVAIESSELQTLAPNSSTLVLTVLLRNHASVAQSWPHLELTLNDATEKVLVRRVFPPAEYLPADINARLGFPARSEQPLRLYFEPEDIKASGYRVYLFYP